MIYIIIYTNNICVIFLLVILFKKKKKKIFKFCFFVILFAPGSCVRNFVPPHVNM